MTDVRRTFTVQQPITKVHDYLKDFANAQEWDPGTVTCTQQSPGPVGVGTTWANVSEFRGKETELTYRLTVDQPGQLVFVGENKTVTSTDTISLSSVGSATEIDYHADFDFHGLANLAVPFIKGELEKLGDDTEKQLSEVLNRL